MDEEEEKRRNVAMTKKKQGKSHKQGRVCKICGKNKTNEKFSGKGYAAHICKKCEALPADEQSTMQTIRRIESMTLRWCTDSELQWLHEQANDPRPEVQAAAEDAYEALFLKYASNRTRKGLNVFSLELYINDTFRPIWGDENDEQYFHVLVYLDDTGVFRLVEYNTPEGEQSIQFSLAPNEPIEFLEVLFEMLFDIEGDDHELAGEPLPGSKPKYRLHLSTGMNNKQTLSSFQQTPDGIWEIFWALMDWIEHKLPEYSC